MCASVNVDGYVRTDRIIRVRQLRHVSIDLDLVDGVAQRSDGSLVVRRRGRLGDVLVLEGGEALLAALGDRRGVLDVELHPPGIAPLR